MLRRNLGKMTTDSVEHSDEKSIADSASRCHEFCGIMTTVVKGIWILERTQNDRFPYRLQITKGDKPWLVLRTQDRWPAAGKHIFCLREDEPPEPNETLEELVS